MQTRYVEESHGPRPVAVREQDRGLRRLARIKIRADDDPETDRAGGVRLVGHLIGLDVEEPHELI